MPIECLSVGQVGYSRPLLASDGCAQSGPGVARSRDVSYMLGSKQTPADTTRPRETGSKDSLG